MFDSHSPALSDLFISSDASIFSTMAFALEILLMFLSQFPLTFPQICSGMLCFITDWDTQHDHLGDVPWEDIFKLRDSAAAREFCVWVQVEIDVYIPLS